MIINVTDPTTGNKVTINHQRKGGEHMSKNIPTIGRIVIYNHPGLSADGEYAPLQSPAIIRQAHVDGTADITVFGPGGVLTNDRVPEWHEGDPKESNWEWPKRV